MFESYSSGDIKWLPLHRAMCFDMGGGDEGDAEDEIDPKTKEISRLKDIISDYENRVNKILEHIKISQAQKVQS